MSENMELDKTQGSTTTELPNVNITPTQYRVSLLNQHISREAALWDIMVEWRGGFRWAVLHLGQCLSKSREWDYEPLPSERTDEWLEQYRFGLDEALELAAEMAPTVSVNGKTPADIVAAHHVLEGSGDAPGQPGAGTVPDGAR